MGVNEHALSWVFAFVLFFITIGLHKAGKHKLVKIVQMVLRLFYMIIIITGILLLMSIDKISFLYILKTAVGIWVIGTLEFILTRMMKDKLTKVFWVQFIISVVIVFYLGYKLPLGMQLF